MCADNIIGKCNSTVRSGSQLTRCIGAVLGNMGAHAREHEARSERVIRAQACEQLIFCLRRSMVLISRRPFG